jgi:subtilisin family serine protease
MQPRSRVTRLGLIVLLVLGLFVPSAGLSPRPAAAAAPASPPEAGPGPHYVPDEVLVRFQPGTTGAAMAAAHAAVGASVVKAFTIVNRLQLVKLAPGVDVKQAIRRYRQNSSVLYAEPNWIVQTAETVPNDSRFGELWGLRNTGQNGGTPDADIDATNAWDLTTGNSNVVVVVIDTGVDYTHEDLAQNMFRNEPECIGVLGVDDDGNGFVDDCHGFDFVNNDGDPMDDNQHGTHVSGTIGAVGNNLLGVAGVNWNVKIMACKFLGSGGSGSTDAAVSCLQYVKTMKDRGVNIVATSNSWGGGGFSQALFDAIDVHRQAGILFIAAAGNSSSNNDVGGFYPANYYLANVIAVAATTRTDAKAGFSSYGRHSVHLGAPGQDILSTTPGNTYSVLSGTSMATPHVTGVAALLEAYSDAHGLGLDWKGIKNRILAGSENIASMASTTITGKRLNAYGALTCINSVVLSRLRPTLNTVVAAAGTPINLDVLHINCAVPNGPVNVSVNPGDQVVTLQDTDGDGIYTGQWAPPAVGNYTLTFPGNDVVQVVVLQPYAYSATSYGYRDITATGTNLNFGDDSTAQITPGFPILFGGSSFNTLFVSNNGNVNFTTFFPDFTNSSLTGPPASAIGTLVAPFWDDLYSLSGTPQNVFWVVTGTSPSRELVVEWRDVRHFSCNADTTATVRFQVVFFEGSSDILFNYADTVFGGACTTADGGASATVGVQTSSNQATTYSFNSPSLIDGAALLWTLAAPPSLGVTPPSLNFGDVAVGSSKDLTFTVQNTGGGTLTVSASTASPFSIQSPPSPFNVGGGATQAVTVRFTPTSTGVAGGNVNFTSNGGTSSPVVSGNGIVPQRSITVTSPSAGVVWANNSIQTITWTSVSVTGNVNIQLSRNGGGSWTTIIGNTPNNGSQSWKVKRPQTNQAQIRVCSASAPSVCGTSGLFTIQ